MNIDYEAEREFNRSKGKLIDVGVSTWVPSKWRLVDLETGDIWRWRDDGHYVRALDIQIQPIADPLVSLLSQLYEMGAEPWLHYVPQPDGRFEWVCSDRRDPLDDEHANTPHEHANTPDEAARGLLEILKRRQAEDEGVFG